MAAHPARFGCRQRRGAYFSRYSDIRLGAFANTAAQPQDEAERVRPRAHGSAARARFLNRYGLGIALLVLSYVLTSAIRDFRDTLRPSSGPHSDWGTLRRCSPQVSCPVAVLSLTVLASSLWCATHEGAPGHSRVVFAGLLLLALSTLAFQAGLLITAGMDDPKRCGTYMAYVPFNAMLFDRLIAASGTDEDF